MNGEMNNNYNNTPNYNYEKNNNGVKVLLIILIMLVLCLIGLTCYKMFIYDKKNDNKKDNNVVENKDNNNQILLSEKLENEIKRNFAIAPYVEILKSNKEISKEIVFYYTIKKIGSCNPMECYGEYINENSKYYKLYNKYHNEIFEKYSLKFDGQTLSSIFDSEMINNSVKELYGKTILFDNEEVIDISRMYPTKVMYIKDIDKFAVFSGGGGMLSEPVLEDKQILDSKYDNGIYKISFLEATYRYSLDDNSNEKKCYVIDKTDNKKEIECFITGGYDTTKLSEVEAKAKEYSLLHKDELSQYEVSFKINSDNTYEFVDIKKVN